MSEDLKAQYEILRELKQVDEKIIRCQWDLQRIPEEVEKLDATLAKRKEAFLVAKEHFENDEKDLRRAETDLKEKEDQLRKAESKMMEVKTNEEYQAALRENQAQKEEKSALEDKALTFLGQVDEHRARLKDLEKEYRDFEAVVTAEKKKLSEEQARVQGVLNDQLQRRAAISVTLKPDVNDLYSRVASRIKGAAVVVVDNGLCMGCNMKVRPQLYNEILGYKFVHRCSNCGRILIPPQSGSPQPEPSHGTV